MFTITPVFKALASKEITTVWLLDIEPILTPLVIFPGTIIPLTFILFGINSEKLKN